MYDMDPHEMPLFDLPPDTSATDPYPFASGLGAAVASGHMAADWAEALAPVEGELIALARELQTRRAGGEQVLPAPGNILRAFVRPLAEARVLIVGQDPYPTPGHSMGLSFATLPALRPIPRSLKNIYTELHDDTGVPVPVHGDLSAWAQQGVVLLNRVLTVAAGSAGSHRKLGWEAITDTAMAALAARGGPLVAILWGNDAQSLAPTLKGIPMIESAHPSPLSARRGFFGSKPFSRANTLLVAQGAAPIDWSIPVIPPRN